MKLIFLFAAINVFAFTAPGFAQNAKVTMDLKDVTVKDVLNEIERNLQDALGVARNVVVNPMLAPGGGALEMELACRLHEKAS